MNITNFFSKHFFALSIIFSVGGSVSLFMTYLVYLRIKSVESFCTVSSTFSCTKVDTSAYSSFFFHIPNGIIGMTLFALVIADTAIFEKVKKVWLLYLNMLLLGASALFGVYLFHVELDVLYAVCIFCVIALAIIFVLLFMNYGEISRITRSHA